MAKLLNGRMWKMLRMFVVALALAILGDWLAVAADLPIPGSTIGMVIVALAFSTGAAWKNTRCGSSTSRYE